MRRNRRNRCDRSAFSKVVETCVETTLSMLLFDGESHGSIRSCSFSRLNAVLEQTTPRRPCAGRGHPTARHSLFDRYMKAQQRLAGGRRKLGRQTRNQFRHTPRVFDPTEYLRDLRDLRRPLHFQLFSGARGQATILCAAQARLFHLRDGATCLTADVASSASQA